MKARKKVGSLVGAIFKKVAPQIGAKVVMEPEWGIVGQITYASGARRYFRNTSIDLNTLGASEIAKDKDYANFFMKRMGYRTIPGQTFFEVQWAKKVRSKRTLTAACVYLLDNANLSTGGDAVDVTKVIHKEVAALAVKLTKDMGLRLCGVDLMIDGDISQPLKKYSILEINSAPGLDHYVTSGHAQRKIVEDMYRQVLTHMEHL